MVSPRGGRAPFRSLPGGGVTCAGQERSAPCAHLSPKGQPPRREGPLPLPDRGRHDLGEESDVGLWGIRSSLSCVNKSLPCEFGRGACEFRKPVPCGLGDERDGWGEALPWHEHQ